MAKTVKGLLLVFIIVASTAAIYYHLQKEQTIIELPALPTSPKQTGATIKKFDTIKKGETLSALLIKNGISQKHIYSIIESFKKIYSARRLKPGESYEIEIDSSGNFYSFTYSPAVEKRYRVYSDQNGKFSTFVVNVDLKAKIAYLNGTIQTTIYDAIVDRVESPELLLSFTDIFQWDIDFFIDPRIGDRFKIVYEKLYLPEADEFVRYGKILASQYISTFDTLTAIYFDNNPGDDGYYDLKGKSFQKTFLKSPLNYRRISSYFSYSRRHPILKKYRPHFGIDYAAPRGTPVSAAADGVVIDKGYDKSIGKFVKIRHKNARFVTLYGHLSRFGKAIQKGAGVKQKQVIGYVGRSGLATGPHLHFAFYDNGRPVDPLKIKNTSGDPMLPENQQQFQILKELMLNHLKRMDLLNIPLIMITSAQVHYNRYTVPDR
ncbi:MAG: peptidoglycan DD-metalloendopeptidase family protein [bacterium]|nr:MAG: peptidoglycan DD-metalloendopeptidase family protein [bacterium]